MTPETAAAIQARFAVAPESVVAFVRCVPSNGRREPVGITLTPCLRADGATPWGIVYEADDGRLVGLVYTQGLDLEGDAHTSRRPRDLGWAGLPGMVKAARERAA